ncbi:MAG: hypothetical protein BGO01_20040 [Armatimonadetes bacterium 55-13]|nr:hypothetical protein [Armatimonadota bacterium]OJU64404.1 MAG: hypothetical protein BGO01_20040 [Armatimonadetes bacterium 55-13]
MRFFVPGTFDASTADVLWSITRNKLQKALDVPIWDRRIQSLSLMIDREHVNVTIGEAYHGEEVLMIFEAPQLLICTAGHGMYRGKPIVVPKERAVAVEFFDA